MKRFQSFLGLSATAFVVSACGGGGGADAALESAQLSQTALFATAQPGASRALSLVTLNKDNVSVSVESATLDYSSRVNDSSLDGTRINGSSMGGTIFFSNASSDFDYEVDLNSGGLAFLAGAAADTEFMFVFTDGARTGVAGERADSLPSGTAVYRGSGNVTINDGLAVSQLNGVATITADFSGNDIDVEIFQDGQGRITIRDASINGNSFRDGQLTLTGGFQNMPASVSADHDGAFFGPGAAEAGGAFAYRNSGSAPIEILGVYSAKR